MTRRPTRSPLVAALLAAVLVVGGAILPPALRPGAPSGLAPLLAAIDAPVVSAAEGLAIRTATRYVVDPEGAAVHVTVDIDATNNKGNLDIGGATTRYYFDGLNIGVQPEARNVRASQDGRSVRVTTENRKGYRLVTVLFADSLFYGETASPRLEFDLPTGKPRSASDVRVGTAFASFLAWAFGDGGSIRVEVPKGFDVDVTGAEMSTATKDDGTQVFKATTDEALSWYAWVNARNDDGLTRKRLALDNGEVIVIRGWPEDGRWQRRVARVMTNGIPALTERIGLPWPVDGPLEVLEIHTPLLEGYAGFYDPESAQITVTEALDDVTMVHEASHAWFNERLFAERWINEGLAETYAADVVRTLGGKVPSAVDPSRDSKVAFPLNDWPGPSPIRDATANAREQYGYNAATFVVRRVVDEAGADGMRAIFAAADGRTIAYVGDAPAEQTAIDENDWRRFLDLAQQLGGVDDAPSLLRTWALTPEQAAQLAPREVARAGYSSLRAAGRGWAVPVGIRLAMDAWQFDQAQTGIRVAAGVLETRDSIETLARQQGLDAPGSLEAAYEGARTPESMAAVAGEAARSEAALKTVIAAAEASTGERDWITEIGLAGKDPDADLAAARDAWEAGSFELASQLATTAAATLAVAPDAGRGRVLVVGGLAGLVLILVLVVAGAGARRRGAASRRRMATAAPGLAAQPLDAPAAAPEASTPAPLSSPAPPEGPTSPFEPPPPPPGPPPA